ncbi:MAG: hypothetical protein ACK4N5_16635, partial [Myxococcales bacterium]
MVRSIRLLQVVTLLAVACGAPRPQEEGACPPEEARPAPGEPCAPILPPEPCEGTTRTAIGARACVPLSPTACPEGFAPSPVGGCIDVHAAECGPGTRATLGQTGCVEVGVARCAPGFAPEPSGWGCGEITPAGCTGATLAILGARACVPDTQCDEPFPPVSATHFVNASYTDAELDATHFRTIRAAIAAAPANATIAVYGGTYSEALELRRPMTLVGRCASQTTLQGQPQVNAILASGPVEVSVRGFTLRGHRYALFANDGASVTLSSLIIEGSLGYGVVATGAPARPATVKLSGTGIRDTRDGGGAGPGDALYAGGGAVVQVTDSVVERSADRHAVIKGNASRADISRTHFADARNGAFFVADGALLTLRESAVRASHVLGVEVEKARAV